MTENFTPPVFSFSFLFFDRFNSSNGDATFQVDFDHRLNQKLLIKPGETSAEIFVNITEDILPESNETFLLTLMTLDEVTTITGGSATITILNNGKSCISCLGSQCPTKPFGCRLRKKKLRLEVAHIVCT